MSDRPVSQPIKPAPWLLTLTLGTLLTHGVSALAYDRSFQPAMFGKAATHLINSVAIPESYTSGSLAVRCETEVRRSGRTGRIGHCQGVSGQQNPAENELARSVSRIVSGLKLVPAKIHGRKQRVWFKYAVVLQRVGEAVQVKVFHNDLRLIKDLGEAYFAPQRFRRFGWSTRSCRRTGSRSGVTTVAVARATVLSDGALKNLSVEVPKGKEVCKQWIQRAVRRSGFIPAVRNGVAVDAEYIEAFYVVR